MANEIFRPAALPSRADPVASEKVPSDNGSSVAGVTLKQMVNAGRPLASRAEAEAGANPEKAMTPLTTRQAMDARILGAVDEAISSRELVVADNLWVPYHFSGDGFELSYNLPRPPVDGRIEVFISGEYQDKESYSVTGSVVTFDSPPEIGVDNVEIYIGGAYAQTFAIPSNGTVTLEKLRGPGLAPQFESIAAAEAQAIPEGFTKLMVIGSAGGEFSEVPTEPAHNAKLKTADGKWWEAKADISPNRLTSKDRETNRATITHERRDGMILDVINLYGDPLKLTKKVGKDVTSDGIARRVTAREFLRDHNYPALINADGMRAATPGMNWADDTHARGCGIQICDGIAYQEWLPSENRTQNIVMMNDGRLQMAYKEDGITATQWVEKGAIWSVGWGAACVLEGVAITDQPSYMNPTVSARTILGQKLNGEIVIILVEGDSNDYGLLPSECGDLALQYGCHIAYICDGGGSTQAWWGNAYAHPSSDSNGTVERALYSYFALDLPSAPLFDTGDVLLVPPAWSTGARQPSYPQVSMRQVDKDVTVRFNLNGTTTPGTSIPLVGAGIPKRFFADGTTQMRGLLHQGVPGYVFSTEAGVLSMSAISASMAYAAGPVSWTVKWSSPLS